LLIIYHASSTNYFGLWIAGGSLPWTEHGHPAVEGFAEEHGTMADGSFHGIRGLRCRSCAVRSNLPSIHPSIHPSIVWLVDRPSIQGFEELLGRVGAAEAATAEALKALAAFAAEAGTKGLKRRPNGKGAMNLKILTHL